jgi:CMP-N-acetylneuraminic acid synthetase
VPFLRPKKFARDDTPTLKVIKHALEYLEKNQSYIPDVVVILQPTSPLRTAKTIDSCISLLKKTNASSVLTVSKVKKHPFSSFWLKSGFLNPLNRKFSNYYQRQKYPNLYFPTGAVYAFWYKTLQKYGTIYGPRIKPVIINDENAVDIDTSFDLFISEMTLMHWNKYRKRFN